MSATSSGTSVQNSQNRDGRPLQIKVNEIICAVGTTQNSFINLQEMPQEELDLIKADFATIAVAPERDVPPDFCRVGVAEKLEKRGGTKSRAGG